MQGDRAVLQTDSVPGLVELTVSERVANKIITTDQCKRRGSEDDQRKGAEGMECPHSLRAVRKASDKAALPGGTRGQPELTLHMILFFSLKKKVYLSASAVPGLSGGMTGLLVVPQEIQCSVWNLGPQAGIESRPPALGAQSWPLDRQGNPCGPLLIEVKDDLDSS